MQSHQGSPTGNQTPLHGIATGPCNKGIVSAPILKASLDEYEKNSE